jgi:hypothetical protein
MYTLIKRTLPPVEMAIFDASNRDQCEVKRLRTNTPLQALLMENDPTVLEASRVLAARLLLDKTTSIAKIVKAFRLILCRKPNERELAILNGYYNDQLKTIDKKTAAKVLNVGEYPVTGNLNKVTLAGMMKVVDTIYNLEEAITKT